MTLEQLNQHIEARIAELKNVKKLAFTTNRRDAIDLVIDELQSLHDLTSVYPSLTSRPVKFEDEK